MRNIGRQRGGEYNLRIVGSDFDDTLPIDPKELQRFDQQATRLKRSHEAILDQLAEKEDRKMTLKLKFRNKTLEEIKDEILKVYPFGGREIVDSNEANVLLSAAFFVGPDMARLVNFTGCPQNVVGDISCRMQDSALWWNGEVSMEHWFDDNLSWKYDSFEQDCSVATGDRVASRTEEGKWEYRASGKSLVTA